MQLRKKRICGGCPFERLAVGVVMRDELIDALHELLDAGERSAPDRLVGDQRKESLDLIQPGAVGRDEVHVPAWPVGQPRLDLRMTVGGVVVDDAMDVELGRHSSFDLAQKRQELLMPMARLATGQHRAIEYVQRGKQRCSAM